MLLLRVVFTLVGQNKCPPLSPKCQIYDAIVTK